jgi:hypothetical protein
VSDIDITAMEPGHFGVQVTEGNELRARLAA